MYGELYGTEREEFEKYLSENPELREYLNELEETRALMSRWPDKEVEVPEVMLTEKKGFRWNGWMSLAASISIFALLGILGLFHVQIDKNGVMIVMGIEKTSPAGLTDKQVEEAANLAVSKYASLMEDKLSSIENDFNEKIDDMDYRNEVYFNSVSEKIQQTNEKYIRSFVARMNENQKKEMQEMFVVSREEQELRIQNMLEDFSSYIAEQRDTDLEYLKTYMETVEENSEFRQYQTEQILSGIIAQVNNQIEIAN